MRKIRIAAAIIASAAILLAVEAAPADAAGWQALAYSANTGAWGRAWDAPSETTAQAHALYSCGQRASDCEIAESYTGCVAVASRWGPGGQVNFWHGGRGATAATADNDALANNNGGTVVQTTCPS